MKTDKEMEEFERYLRSDEVRPSHTFLLNEAKSYPAFTTHGLNQLPYVLMPSVALCMEKYADQEKQALKDKLIKKVEASHLTGLSKATVYALITQL